MVNLKLVQEIKNFSRSQLMQKAKQMGIKGLLGWRNQGSTSKYYTTEILQDDAKKQQNNLRAKQNTMNKIMGDLKKTKQKLSKQKKNIENLMREKKKQNDMTQIVDNLKQTTSSLLEQNERLKSLIKEKEDLDWNNLPKALHIKSIEQARKELVVQIICKLNIHLICIHKINYIIVGFSPIFH
jgi:chromosome segregation ATPase